MPGKALLVMPQPVTILDTVQVALSTASKDLEVARNKAAGANARLKACETEHTRLKRAVAALEGFDIPAVAKADLPSSPEVKPAEDLPPPDFSNPYALPTTGKKKKQPKKGRLYSKDHPMSKFKCTGCGEVGTTQQTLKFMPKSGKQILIWQCTECKSERLA